MLGSYQTALRALHHLRNPHHFTTVPGEFGCKHDSIHILTPRLGVSAASCESRAGQERTAIDALHESARFRWSRDPALELFLAFHEQSVP